MANPTQNIQSVPLFKLEIRHKTTLNTSVKMMHKLASQIGNKHLCNKFEAAAWETPDTTDISKTRVKKSKITFSVIFLCILAATSTNYLSGRQTAFI